MRQMFSWTSTLWMPSHAMEISTDVACVPARFDQHALEERVIHAHAIRPLQDGLDDADCQSAVPVLQLMPAQRLLSHERVSGIMKSL